MTTTTTTTFDLQFDSSPPLEVIAYAKEILGIKNLSVDLEDDGTFTLRLGSDIDSRDAISDLLAQKFCKTDSIISPQTTSPAELPQALQQVETRSTIESLRGATDFQIVSSIMTQLDNHLRLRTVFANHILSESDFKAWSSLKCTPKAIGLLRNGAHPHLLRWYHYMEGLPGCQKAISEIHEAKKRASDRHGDTERFQLPNAQYGAVVTRFPPEPSGYLHIGHVKAALLNATFAEKYNGKLIIRFDDTNPDKEKGEFEDAILADLTTLGIRGDQISHTSDLFPVIHEYAVQLIKAGKAYVDETDKDEMQHQRLNRLSSPFRDRPIQDNLEMFSKLTHGLAAGSTCLRAKIDYRHVNGAMRDPTIYRAVDEPHSRTGTLWRVYPTYDFACPIVDSLEGVTHALRSNEYRDRNPQYSWMLQALGLRQVTVFDFSRLNFVYTMLSKRKLRQCLELGLADCWNDPRFPTLLGMMRRGLTVEALKRFIMSQGPSHNQVLLEWDSIWALNKQVIDPISPRFVAINEGRIVKAAVDGASRIPQTLDVPRHKKEPKLGRKKITTTNEIFIEQDDASGLCVGEEITLMDWGNAFVREISQDTSGAVSHLRLELHLAGEVKATEKKVTWIAALPNKLTRITLVDFGYMVTKKAVHRDDDLKAIATSNSKWTLDALSDENMLGLNEGDCIQFERKGYFILDSIENRKENGEEEPHFIFILIPDGHIDKSTGPAYLFVSENDDAPEKFPLPLS